MYQGKQLHIHDNLLDMISLAVTGSIKRWCLYLKLTERSKDNISKSCLFFSQISRQDQEKIRFSLMWNGWCLVQCKNKTQCEEFYNLVDKKGSGGIIMAATISPDGTWTTEHMSGRMKT